MRQTLAVSAFIVVVFVAGALAQQPTGTAGMNASGGVMIEPSEATFSPAPDALPAGAQLSLLAGDPMSSGPFTIRLKMPDGYRIPPHTHPTEEQVTVVQGTLKMGMGDQVSESAMKTLSVGGFARMPQGTSHYVQAQGDTVVQVSGPGPFAIKYVNASDDPRNKK